MSTDDPQYDDLHHYDDSVPYVEFTSSTPPHDETDEQAQVSSVPDPIPPYFWQTKLTPPRSRPIWLYRSIAIVGVLVIICAGSYILPNVMSLHAGTFSTSQCRFVPDTSIKEGTQLTCGYVTVPEDR